MKILQINAVYGTGSTGRIVADISDTIKRAGGESFVAYQSTIEPVENAFVMGSSFTRKVDALRARVFGLQAYGSKRATKRLLRWMDEIKPDVVHLHNLHSHYIHLPLLCKYLAKKDIPTVITLHDCWFFTGKCTHYTSAKCNKWQTGCGNCPQLKKDIPSWLFDRTAKMWKDKKELFSAIPRLAVIGVSDWITNEAKKSFLQNAKIIQRIYNWIDLQTFYPREENIREQYHLPKDKFLIFCIGAGWNNRMEKWRDLLRLAQKLPSNMHIVLGGSVQSPQDLPDNITSIGYIHSTENLAKLYAGVDAYVHLSREDTFGKVIAEAMACGTPAVVYNATACPELVGKGCGYVVKTGDIDGICVALQMIQEKGKSAYLEKCVAYVREHFEKEKLIEDTVALYEAVQR
ncbi:MAG: glycosyltransferase [Clostridia bacterium]|nr:glycosyltransferase [Clostridia bacterium]